MKLPNILHEISDILHSRGAKAIVVGGSVRDHFLDLEIKDYDVEVYGLDTFTALEQILSIYGSVNLVGKNFGVLKFHHEGEEYDFSFPRVETKTGAGHRGFEVKIDASIDYLIAFKRRDFTINAMGYDIKEAKFIDPYRGMEDIQNRCIRHINDDTFVEDPLRVYRAVQFSARFDYHLHKETIELCRDMVKRGLLDELPKERVWAELSKLMLKSQKPSIGFELMRELDILERYFPELYAITGVEQSIQWHPEGDVWIHTMMCIDAMATLCQVDCKNRDERYILRMLWAILCHDLGKATCTTIDEDGRVKAIGHEYAGIEPTREILNRVTNEHNFIESILPLVEHHLKPSIFYKAKSKDKAIRRLATKVNIEELTLVAKADFLGRTTAESIDGIYKAGEWMLAKAKELQVEKTPISNLLQGRDLISLGYKPSSLFGDILNDVYEKVLEGELSTKNEAIEYVKLNFKEERFSR